jgi:hypothetical protein
MRERRSILEFTIRQVTRSARDLPVAAESLVEEQIPA